MSDKINIDELLKQELGNMTPEPPAGIWESVSNQVQAAQPAQPLNPAATATKAGIAGSKAIITAAVLAFTSVAGFVGYKLYNADREEIKAAKNEQVVEPAKQEITVQPEQAAEEAPAPSGRVVPATQETAKKEKHASNRAAQTKSVAESKISQPVFKADQPDRVADVTDPLVNNKQAAKAENENNLPKQNADAEENPVQPVQETEEQQQQFEAPFIPNVFTPNVDGKNDEFAITLENETLYDLKITDRKGNIVFESKDKNRHWDGVNMYTGVPCEEGMYIYAFKYQLKGMKEAETKAGWINLRLSPRQ